MCSYMTLIRTYVHVHVRLISAISFIFPRLFKLFMALVAILNSVTLLFFYQPVQNNDTKRVNDIIVSVTHL